MLTGRERFADGRFLARVDANRTLAPSTLESGSRPEQVWTRPYLTSVSDNMNISSTELFSDILIITLKTQFRFLIIYHVATNNM